MKTISVLGSTGSIGTQTLNIVRRNPDKYRITALTANHNAALLNAQAAEFKPAFSGSGAEALNRPEAYGADIVVVAVSGAVGLSAVLNALKCGVRHIALANKEAIVAGGGLVMNAARGSGAVIVPVDSEHSAIFQCLRGDERREIKRVVLTASGGPFLRYSREQLEKVTLSDALKHPTFQMGVKITVDSATMMNKGFELIEAKFLFGLSDAQIEYIVHPQSIIHSMVEFADGSHFAQMSYPDMEIPISYALSYPERLKTAMSARPIDFAALKALTFEPLSDEQFPCFRLAKEAMRAGGAMPCALLAADEEAVAAFAGGKIRFTQIYDIIDGTLNRIDNTAPRDFQDIAEADRVARKLAQELMNE